MHNQPLAKTLQPVLQKQRKYCVDGATLMSRDADAVFGDKDKRGTEHMKTYCIPRGSADTLCKAMHVSVYNPDS